VLYPHAIALSWAVVAAPLADEQPSQTIDIQARVPGNPLGANCFKPAQPQVNVDDWGHPVDNDGLDVWGVPAARVAYTAPDVTFSPSPFHNPPPDSNSDQDNESDNDSENGWGEGGAAALYHDTGWQGQGPF